MRQQTLKQPLHVSTLSYEPAVHLLVYSRGANLQFDVGRYKPQKKAMTMIHIKSALVIALLFIMTACASNSPAIPTATLVDIPALQTSVFQTVAAEIAKTATASAPSSTPTPTATPIPPTGTITLPPTITPPPTLVPTATQPWNVPFGSEDRDLYINREVPPYPSGYSRYTGGILDNENYAIETYQTEDGSQGLIFLQYFLRHDSQGKAHYRIVDAVILNDIPAGEYLTSDCSMNDVFRDDLIILGKGDPDSDPPKLIIDRIWQISLAKERLQKMDRDRFECFLLVME